MFQKWLVPGLICVGTLLIIFSIWSPKNQFLPNPTFEKNSLTAIATAVEVNGDCQISNFQMPSSIPLKLNSIIKPRDIIRTGENSDVVIQLQNEAQFRLTDKSEIIIDQLDNGSPLIIIRSGEIYVEKFGNKPSFWVRKDGQLLSALDFALSDKSYLNKLKEPIPIQSESDQMSQTEIETILNNKKNDFFKCYGQVLQKNSQARGSVLISFSIQNFGQTQKIEVTQSDIDDPIFKSCLTEVVARTQFKKFSGNPITTVFPLKFE